MNYRQLNDLPDGRTFRQLDLINHQTTILSVKGAGPDAKAAKSAAIKYTMKLLAQNC